jgi:Icc-related predicted phosphoesterase
MDMMNCFFVSDLHGQIARYEKLFLAIQREKPKAVFIGGDLLPSGVAAATPQEFSTENFIREYLQPKFRRLRQNLEEAYPQVYIIFGNDDPRSLEKDLFAGEANQLWVYIHQRRTDWGGFPIYGYAYVPPTPFLLKDWERYDVSRFVDPGCISPEEGRRSIQVSTEEIKFATIWNDLNNLAGDSDLSKAIFLFHTPPYQSALDRAALDGKHIDHVPLDVHVGSIAVRRFIEARQPLITLHGHIHEAPRLTGIWKDKIGRTLTCTAAYDGPELALVRFDLLALEEASREII